MSNYSQALADAVRSGACQVLGVPEYINDALDRVSFFPFTEARRAIPDFWRNMLCDRPAPPPNPPQFTGGQCSTLYSVRGTARTYSPTACTPSTTPFDYGNYWGPIASVGITRLPDGVNGKQYALRFSNYGNGSFPMSIPQVTTAFVGGSGFTCPDVTLLSFTPVRVDGLPDNCGNPPPVYEPVEPGDVTVNTDFTYNDFSGAQITVPVVLVYARANIDARANITIPFTANINGELNVTGNLNLDGTVDIDIGTAGGGGAPKDPRKSPCDDIALPTETPPEDPTDSEQPEQPDRDREETIIGALVTVTALSNERASTIIQDDNPDIYAPSLGHIQFLCRVGDTSAAWTSDQPVKNRRNLIPCPWPTGAIVVRGTPQPGVTWTITPVTGYAGLPVEYVTA